MISVGLNRHPHHAVNLSAVASVLCLLVALCGCATKQVATREPVFYPPDRAIARLQHLVSFGRPEDIQPKQSPLLTFLVGEPPPKQGIIKPYGTAIYDGKVFVCDTIGVVIHVIDPVNLTWEYFHPSGPGRLLKPINLDIDDDGTRYVADPVRGNVAVYDARGNYRATIGEEGTSKPVDVQVSGDHVYVADIMTRQVLVYDKRSLKRLFAVPRESDNADEQLFAPTNVDVDKEGRIYVSDSGGFRVQVYDAEGNYLRTIGRHGDSPGEFVRNKGIAIDPDLNAYVVDAAFQNVQIFNEEGQLLLFFAEPGSGAGADLRLPADIAIDVKNVDVFRQYVAPGFELEYIVLVTSQTGLRKVNVYGFGHNIDKTGANENPE